MDKIDIIFSIVAILFLLSLGWIGNIVYTEWNNVKQINGLWLSNFNKTRAMEKAYEMDDSNQWICVNIDKTMNYQDCLDISAHECGHELFAKKCQDKPEVCFKLMESLNETE